MKILVILVHSTQNAGDLALLKVSILHLEKYFKNPHFTISANYPDEVWYKENDYKVVPSPISLIGKPKNIPYWLQLINFIWGFLITLMFIFKVRLFIPRNWNILLGEYESSDIVVAVPGNQLFSTGRWGWPLPVTIFSVFLAILFKKPLYVLPQSIGPFKRWWERILIRLIYSKAKLIFLRDEVSMEIANKIGLPDNKIFFAHDPAIALEPSKKKSANEFLSKYGWSPEMPSLGVTIIAPMGHFLDSKALEKYYSVLASTLIQFSSKWDVQVVLYIQVSGPTEIENDRIPTSEIYKKIVSKVKVIYIDEILTPEMLKACYGEMDIFLASRLHSGIFSISMGVPTVFIGYLSKTIGFLRAIGLEKYGLSLSEVDQSALLKVLEDLWLSRNEISLKLRELTNSMISEIDITFNKIYSDFEIWKKKLE